MMRLDLELTYQLNAYLQIGFVIFNFVTRTFAKVKSLNKSQVAL